MNNNDKSHAANSIVFQEHLYHKTSMLKIHLGTYLEKTKFKFEIAPAKDSNSNVRNYNYDASVAMVFDLHEVIRIKKILENLLTPSKTQEDFVIEHFFEVGGVKKKSVTSFGRKAKNTFPMDEKKRLEQAKKDPYAYPNIIIMSISTNDKSCSFGFTDEEAYLLINMIPLWCNDLVKEKARATKVMFDIKKSLGNNQESSGKQKYNNQTPAEIPPQNEAAVVTFDEMEDVPF